MHYCIATMIAEKINISGRSEFLLGGIAPDIHGLMGVAKGITHFKERDEVGKNHINYKGFYETYRELINEPFYLGYLCHLISDWVWNDMYFKKVKFVSSEQWNQSLQATYRDYAKLNGRIIRHYSLAIHELKIPDFKINIEQYDVNFLPSLVGLLVKDFEIDESHMNEPLELFENDNREIIDYINKSVFESINFLSSVSKSKSSLLD